MDAPSSVTFYIYTFGDPMTSSRALEFGCQLMNGDVMVGVHSSAAGGYLYSVRHANQTYFARERILRAEKRVGGEIIILRN